MGTVRIDGAGTNSRVHDSVEVAAGVAGEGRYGTQLGLEDCLWRARAVA